MMFRATDFMAASETNADLGDMNKIEWFYYLFGLFECFGSLE